MSQSSSCLRHRNARTRVVEPGDLPTASLTARDVFHAIYDRIRDAAAMAIGPNMFVAAVEPGRVFGYATLVDGRALTIGRHEQCALRIDADETSLRHLVAHVRLTAATPTHAARAVTHLWDLATVHPFRTEDGLPTSGVIADGPLFVSLGAISLAFVPLRALSRWPLHADAAWDQLPPRQFLDRRAERVVHAPRGAHGDRMSVVTRVRAPSFVGIGTGVGSEPAPPCAELAIEHERGSVVHQVSSAQLDEGVLVGRYSRCQVGLTHDDGVSRVHLLIVRIDDEIWAIDTASTNGTTRGDTIVSAIALRERDALQLASETTVRWRLLPRPAQA